MPAQSAREAAEPIAAEAKVALRASGFIQHSDNLCSECLISLHND
jgi:hypothetical protein